MNGVSHAQVRSKQPVPAGARVRLVFDKPRYFLGENVLAQFCVENIGSTPFTVESGGDYRGAARSTRFKVSATGLDGTPVADPFPGDNNMGGLGGPSVVAPGQTWYASLPLVRYCRFDRPGVYTLHVKHDLGWQEPVPVAEAALTLVMPTPAQARQVIAAMDALPPDSGTLTGQKSRPWPDFAALRYPVYLPLLRERARTGDAKKYTEALAGIGGIPTTEATRTLLALMDASNPAQAREAAVTLAERLPDPPPGAQDPKPLPFEAAWREPRRWLSGQSWRPAFAPRARAAARRLLNGSNTNGVEAGAEILARVGAAADLTPVVAALDRIIGRTDPGPITWDGPQAIRNAMSGLEWAARECIARGAFCSPHPQTPGEADVFLVCLAAYPTRQPSDWDAETARLLDAPSAYVRARTLATLSRLPGTLPTGLTNALRRRLPLLLTDADMDVQVPACELAQKLAWSELREPVLKALASAHVFPLTDDATNAAIALGARWEALSVWADRLGDPARRGDALGFLIKLLDWDHGYGIDSNMGAATADALRARWRAFLGTHRAEIESGHRYPLGSPDVRDLFPKSIYSFS